MDIDKILQEYDQRFLDEKNREIFQLDTQWNKGVPTESGVYAFFDKDKIIYIGETGSLKGRMSDVRRTVNHTLRRTIGNKLFSNTKDFNKATSKKKFPEHIEILINEYMEKLYVTMIPISFGRAEIEEYLIEKYNPVFNTKTKRKSV